MTDPLAWIADELASWDAAGLRRRRPLRQSAQQTRCLIDGREVISFASNDYLALAADPRLVVAFLVELNLPSWGGGEGPLPGGWGSGASPLLGGWAEPHRCLEERLARFEHAEAALVFSSGFVANASVVAALVGPGDAVFCDAANHASLFDGCRLSRADVRVYPHNDLDRLAELLARGNHRRRLIVTDGLFSMDGDLAPLTALADLAREHGAMLLVDEAHATGVFGESGRGSLEHCGVDDPAIIRIGTLSKALGSLGGFVAGRAELIEYLVGRARGYVFSTAIPAVAAAAGLAALEIVVAEPWLGRLVLQRSERLRQKLRAQGWNVGRSESQIIPLIVGSPSNALALSEALRQRGWYVPAVRPPTVPENQCRLRISVTLGHLDSTLDELAADLAELAPDGLWRRDH